MDLTFFLYKNVFGCRREMISEGAIYLSMVKLVCVVCVVGWAVSVSVTYECGMLTEQM